MGYSDSKQTLEKIRPMLYKLEAGQGDSFPTRPGEKANELAYRIREALYIASLYPTDYPRLAMARRLFKVQIVSPTQVQAVLLSRPTLPESPGPIGLEPAGPMPFKVMGKQTAGLIIEHILGTQQMQPGNTQYQFPEAKLNKEESLRVYNWCRRQTPPWIFMQADGRVTIARKSRDITEDLAWEPEDED